MDQNNLSYVVGLAIGDGNLTNPNGRAVRLRISCDTKYFALMVKIRDAIQNAMPNNKVSVLFRSGSNCADISCYSNQWEAILGWQAKGGSKFVQNVRVPEWIKQNRDFTIACLRGLIETDGTIYNDRGYPMIMFVTIISDLADDFFEMVTSLGFSPRLYRIGRPTNLTWNHQPVYHIRLAKKVEEFLKLVRPEKI